MRRKSILVYLLILLPVSVLLGQGSTEDFIIKIYGPGTGLSNNTIRAIAQDYKGYIWIGTMDGLNRFDGQSFKVYRNSSADGKSISNSNILCLLEDRDSTLWIGTRGGGLNRFNRRLDNFISYQYIKNDSQSISHNEIFVMYEDREGNMWVGTDGGGLNLLNKKTGKFKRYIKNNSNSYSLAENEVLSIAENAEGNLLIGTWGGGLSILDKASGRFSKINQENSGKKGLANDNVWVINHDEDNVFWLGLSGEGVQVYNSVLNEFRSVFLNKPGYESNRKINPFTILKSKDKTIWIGTGEGLFKSSKADNKDLFRQKIAFEKITRKTTYSLFEDKFGSIWFGTKDEGLGQVFRKNKKFTIINIKYPDEGEFSLINDVNTICGDNIGNLWLGTVRGVIQYDSKRNTYKYPGSSPRWSAKLLGIHSMYCDSKGNIWAGNLDELTKYDPSSNSFKYFFSLAPINGKASNEEYWRILEDSPNELWLGTSKGLYKLNILTRKYKTFIEEGKIIDGRNAYHIRSLGKDKHGNLLVGTLGGGMFVIDSVSEKMKHYYNDPHNLHSLINDFVFYIHRSMNGEIWLATSHGLDFFDQVKDEFVHYQTSQGLPSDVIYGILEDEKQNLWISSNNGISKFELASKKFSNFFFYDQKNYSSFIQRSCFKDRNGRMYFGRAESLIAFNPDSIQSDTSTVNIIITDFKINNKSIKALEQSPLKTNIEDTRSINLKYNQSSFSFEFSAVNYIYPENNKYMYRLENFDPAWVNSGNRNLAVYTNIPPGDYIFQVKASNLDGVWKGNGVKISIHISPPIWQTWLFRIVVAGLILLAFFGWYYQKIRLMKARQLQLENLVKSRTVDLSKANTSLQEQKEQLAKQNTDLIQTQTDLSESNQKLRYALDDLTQKEAMLIHSEKMASIGVLTAGIAHEINNPLNFIQSGVYALEQIYSGIDTLIRDIEKIYGKDISSKPEIIYRMLKAFKDEEYLSRYKESMNIILLGVDRSTSIIRSMRYYMHPEVTEKLLTNMDELIDSSVIILKSSMKQNIKLETDYKLTQKVDCVPGNISQVVLNLLMNAAQAIGENGKIIVKAYKDEKGLACISVKDNGTGMSEEELKHLYEPFYTTKPVGQGTGLGLFISYNIIKNHNGSIQCKSVAGEGTEFIVSLPLNG